jgi:hypothetical protein
MKFFHRIFQLSSWIILFLIQSFFNINPTENEWLRIYVLITYIILVTVAWIKLIEGLSLTTRLNLNPQTVVLFTYSISSSIIILFIKQNFSTAALIAGGSMILPVFEELYFRAFLLGSVSYFWPMNQTMTAHDRKVFLKESLVYLL